jgi:hypothetical protein
MTFRILSVPHIKDHQSVLMKVETVTKTLETRSILARLIAREHFAEDTIASFGQLHATLSAQRSHVARETDAPLIATSERCKSLSPLIDR